MKNWELAFEVLKVFEDNGFEAYIVGGAVRDYLLKRKIHDIDIATSAEPETVRHLFEKTIPVGIKHGTVIVRFKGESFEVTTFRKESGYHDYRHPSQVEFTDSIVEDLKRRDYTMNAIAFSSKGSYIDPFSGEMDLNNKCLRTVGNPSDRFNEDPLRILRGIRFISLLGLSAPLSVIKAMTRNSPKMEYISKERKWEEMNKLLNGKHLITAFAFLYLTKCTNYLPGFEDLNQEKLNAFPISHLDLSTDAEKWAGLMLIGEVQDPLSFCEAWGMSKAVEKNRSTFDSFVLSSPKTWVVAIVCLSDRL